MVWLYISGRGHSGTTFLDIALGNASEIQSFGEVMSACNRLEDLCACGAPMNQCVFWARVIAAYESTLSSKWLPDMEFAQSRMHIKYWLSQYFNIDCENSRVKETDKGLLDTLKKEHHSARYVVDSSKEPTRALFLLNTYPDARVIHMVRNPFDVIASYKKRYLKHGYFRFLRVKYRVKSNFWLVAFIVAASWVIGNLMLELTSRRHPGRVYRIRHEDLLHGFVGEMEKLSRFLLVNLDRVVEIHHANDGFQIGHNIGGNSIRTTGSLVLDSRRSDVTLTRFERFVVRFATLPMRWRYGY